MAKRFIDTNMFHDEWFMDLSKDAKLFYIYLITTCNHAGIVELNNKLCQFQTGIKELQTVIKELGNRLVTVKENVYFLPKFIKFQYPNFPQSNVKQQESAINILTKYGLFSNGELRVTKDLVKSYDNDNVSVSEEDVKDEFNKIPPELKDVEDFFLGNGKKKEDAHKFFYHYEAQDWYTGGVNPQLITRWRPAAQKWMLNSKNFPDKNSNVLEVKFG